MATTVAAAAVAAVAAAVATTPVKHDVKRMVRNSSNAGFLRSENYMLLSTTYALNNSDTKRLQVGLRTSSNEGTQFDTGIKLYGNSAAGINFDEETWMKFQGHLETAGCYLRGIIRDMPNPIIINNVILQFTTAYGARAISVISKEKISGEETTATASGDPEDPPPKRRRTYAPSVVMQRTSFEGLENIVKCVNARCEQLNSLKILIGDCARFLVSEIELCLPKRSLDEDVIKQVLANKYQDVEQNVRRQLKDLTFLDSYYGIIFQELTSLHLNEIVRTVIINAATPV